MITSSPSPTLHSRNSSSQHAYHSSRTNVTNRASSSTTSMTRPSSFSEHSPASINQRPSLASKPATADAATQYSPQKSDSPASARNGKRKDRSDTPPLEPQGEQNAVAKVQSNSSNHDHAAEPTVQPPSGSPVASSSQAPAESAQKRLRGGDLEPKVMPLKYEECRESDLVDIIAAMLMELIRYNDAMPLQDGKLTRFHSRAPPGISVNDYLQRLTTHATLSPPILLSMVYYIDRLCALYPAFSISSLTVHRFLISSATVASKGLSDAFWTNNTYARVGGVSVRELALLELEFLWRIEWRIVPKPEVLVDYYKNLVARSPGHTFPPTNEPEAASEAASAGSGGIGSEA